MPYRNVKAQVRRTVSCSSEEQRCNLLPEMKDTTISLKIERHLKTKLLALAEAENRSLSNFIEKLLKAEVAKHESKAARVKTD